MLGWIGAFEKGIAQFIAMRVIFKADGVIPLAVQVIINLHAVALGYVARYATISKVFKQSRSLQAGDFNIFKGWFFLECHWLIGLLHSQLHLLGDELRPFDEVCFSCQLTGKVENVATSTAPKIEP